MLAHARSDLPCEACGLLGGRGDELLRFVPCRNALASPRRYEISPEEILAAERRFADEGLELRGIFHSHPEGPARPSDTDLREAAYPKAVYLIAAPKEDDLRAFRLTSGEMQEVRVE